MTTKEAKRQLYSTLLLKDEKDLTYNEIDLMCHLSRDKEIREIISERLGVVDKTKENKI